MISLILANDIRVQLVPVNYAPGYSDPNNGADEQGTAIPMGAKEKLKEAQVTIEELCSGVAETVSQVYNKIADGLKACEPQEVTLKFTVGVGVQGNVLIGGVSGSSTFEVTAKWVA